MDSRGAMESRELAERTEQPVFYHARPALETTFVARVDRITVRELFACLTSFCYCSKRLSLLAFPGTETCLRPFLQPSILGHFPFFARWSRSTVVRWRAWHHLL